MKRIFEMKSFGVYLSRNKFYTLVNVVGFSVSLMFVILIMLYARQEYSVDKIIDKADRIYTVCTYKGEDEHADATEGSHWFTQRTIKKTFPQVEMTCGVVYSSCEVGVSDKVLQTEVAFADSTFFRMFSIPVLQGNAAHALDEMSSAVVSEEFARKAWGNDNPIGKRIHMDGMDDLMVHVTAVYKGMQGTSFGQADIIMRFEYVRYKNDYLTASHMGNAVGASVFILAQPGYDLCTRHADFDKMYKDMGFWYYSMDGSTTRTRLLRLSDRYFSDTLTSGSDSEQSLRGNRRLVTILFAVGLIILLFSVFNYINLSTAQSGKRAREMATRRLMGAQRSDIVLRLTLEGVLLCLVSLLLGVALAWAACPYASALLHAEIHMSGLLDPLFLSGILVIVLLAGGVSGAVPAAIISRVRPIDVVRGTFRLRTRMTLSRVFIVMQNVATIVMVSAALSIWMQTHHLVHAPMGYNLEHLLALPSISGDTTKVQAFMSELRQLSCVESAALSMGYPLQGGNNNTITHDGHPVSLQAMYGDSCFFRTLGLGIALDHHQADPAQGIWVNRQFLAEMGLKETDRVVNDPALNQGPLPINGVLEDFKIRTVTSIQAPVFVVIGKIYQPWDYLVRVKGDETEALDRIDEVYFKVFQRHIADFDTHPYLMQKMRERFSQEEQMGTIVALFALVAILISVLGLVAMSTYFIEQRLREVAVRKVFGSTSSQVCRRLTVSFLAYALVAFVVAAPLAYWLIGRWLTTFSYRIQWWPFVLIAGLVCLFTSFLAVIVQSRLAAGSNPVEHLKDE